MDYAVVGTVFADPEHRAGGRATPRPSRIEFPIAGFQQTIVGILGVAAVGQKTVQDRVTWLGAGAALDGLVAGAGEHRRRGVLRPGDDLCAGFGVVATVHGGVGDRARVRTAVG